MRRPASELWIRAWAGVHAVRPAAADGFSVMPSGSVTVTRLDLGVVDFGRRVRG